LKKWGILAIPLAAEMLGSRSTAPKIHITASNPNKLWATILAHCLGNDII